MTKHKHEIWGEIFRTSDNKLKIGFCRCKCMLTSELAPEGARYNWENWKVANGWEGFNGND